jgi:hypothetical protein
MVKISRPCPRFSSVRFRIVPDTPIMNGWNRRGAASRRPGQNRRPRRPGLPPRATLGRPARESDAPGGLPRATAPRAREAPGHVALARGPPAAGC